jgi:glycosyltransferase involved in cell wall biosynthesis
VTVPSENMARRAEELGFDAERLTLGVALDRWPVRAPRTRPAGRAFRLLSVGSINRVKDHTTLLRAVALLRARGVDICLDCVGEDTLGGAAARLAAELGLDQVVRFHGFLPYDALRARFEDADALVVSSRHEADPIAALEAAVAGLAVVGTAVGHLTEWAPDAALICEPANAAALAAVITAVVHDESLRLRLARAAQARAVDNNADRAADRVLALYHELAGHA